jgi:hypothetical protein
LGHNSKSHDYREIPAAVLFPAVGKNVLVTHFPTLFLHAYGRSQFGLVLLYPANVRVWDTDLTLLSVSRRTRGR